MTKNSRAKGAEGERNFVRFLISKGFDAKRYGHFQRADGGSVEFADVRCKELSDFHIEVKRKEKMDIWACLKQTIGDAVKAGKIPLLGFRRNHSEWYICMRAEDFVELIKQRKKVRK